MHTSLIPVSCSRTSAARYLSCLRAPEIIVLQGSPLLGAAFALGHASVDHIGPLAIPTIANVCLVAHVFVLNDCAIPFGTPSRFGWPGQLVRTAMLRLIRPYVHFDARAHRLHLQSTRRIIEWLRSGVPVDRT